MSHNTNVDDGRNREKSKEIGPMRGLWPFVRPYLGMVILAGVALVSTAVISLMLPLAVRQIVDGFADGASTLLDQYFIAALGIAALMAAGSATRYYLVTRLGERIVTDIRMAVYDKMIGMSPAFFERIMTGEVLSRITTDTTLILSVIGSSVSVALRNILMFVGGIVFMMFTSPSLAGMVLLLVPAVVIPLVLLGRKLRDLSRLNQDKIAESSGNASETLLAAQTVQAFTHENPSRARFASVTEESFDAALKRVGVRALMTMSGFFLVFAGMIGVLWIAADFVRTGDMTPGDLVQFVIYAVMVGGSVAALSEIWGELQRAAGATERLVELLEAEDTVQDPSAPVILPADVSGRIAFEDVVFRYPSRPKIAALDGVSFSVEPGETIALVGPSGAGKSTIFQLLQRFFDPTSGRVLFDGIDLRDMDRESFRKNMAMVPQDPVIFGDSARENIRFGRPDATDAEVVEAAKAAAAHEFLSELPEGYDSYVGERGVMLSGGQRQRIAIARSILRAAPVLLLDEATSALDAESELAVQKAVEAMSKDRTTLIVAHRLATVKKADRIIVFDKGQIVATGSHDELVGQGGLYARLAKLQFTDGNTTS